MYAKEISIHADPTSYYEINQKTKIEDKYIKY